MTKVVDLTGKRFGRLVAIEPAKEKTRNGLALWKCKCDCGNMKIARSDNLKKNRTMSCGCLNKEIAINRLDCKRKTNQYKDKYIKGRGLHNDTADCLLNDTMYKDNSTGVRGVTRSRSGKFIAQIGYKKHNYYLGTFETLELAKFARKEAEKKIWGKDLE